MLSNEVKLDWLYRLKRKMLLSILLLLAMSIAVSMVFIERKLQKSLINDSKVKTQELADTIDANLHHLMILRAPEAIQNTLEHLVEQNESITKTVILNEQGKISYSSDKSDVGTVLYRDSDASCRVCHSDSGVSKDTDVVVLSDGGKTHRNVSLIYNEKDCYECHDPAIEMNGKLVIDRSLGDTFALIEEIQLILVGTGLVSLFILFPLLSRLLSKGVDRYIAEIFTRNEELRLLYVMVERLSKTLDIVLLKEIVVEIFKDILDADEVDLILARGENEYSASVWTRDSGKTERCKIEDNSSLSEKLAKWQDGVLSETTVSADKTELCMPIGKGDHRLALITVRKKKGRFEENRLKLSSVIGSHIGVAFDNARLYYIAITDELTKTFNKRHFRTCIDNTFGEFQQYGTRFGLLMMDLDKFKQVNDTHGHVVGDSVLQTLGEIIRQSVRENDLAFRYGGEEFAIILPDTSEKGARYVAERIRTATESTVFEPGTIDLKLTISIGICTCPDAPSIRDLIIAADKALYQAKDQGRNQVVVSEQVFEESTAHAEEEVES